MARLARRYAPDDPSTDGKYDLSESIDVGTRTKSRDRTEGKATVNLYMGPTDPFHGIFQEWGTVNHGPQPFMRPAWDHDKDNLIERLRLELWDSISAGLERARRRGAL